MKTFIPVLAVVLVFCQMEFKTEKNTDFSVLKIDTPKIKDELICEITNRNAQFKGGDKEFLKFITSNFKYPQTINCDVSKVSIRFIVEKDGSIPKDCIKVVNPICEELTKEVIRIMALSPNWEPAVDENDKPIRQRKRIPLRVCIKK